MSYFSGSTDLPVKPVTRRITFTRGKSPQIGMRYLQRKGRKPLNRHAYPTMGYPVPGSYATEPGQFAGVNDPVMLSVRSRAGRRFQTRPYDPFSAVALGASILDPIAPLTSAFAPSGPETILSPMSITTNFVPSIPSVVAAPTPQPSTVWNPITSILNLWNERPQVMKDIRLSVNPQQAMAALQTVVKPGQVSGAVDLLRSWGINPSYQGVPVTGPMAGYGYQVSGMNLGQYLPWIIGGGALLFLVPMLMKR